MKFLKKLSRTVLFPFLFALGFDRFLFRKVNRKLCIINFHGVRTQAGNPFNNRHIPVSEFEKIIHYLSKNFDIVPLSTAFEYHRSKKILSKKTVALTFDDGYENNFSIALPILKKYQVPATYYIITKGLEDEHFVAWPDKIDLLKKGLGKDILVDSFHFPHPSYFNPELNLELTDYLKTQGARINQIVDELYQKSSELQKLIDENKQLFQLISGEAFKNFSKEPLIEYGSHTHLHPNLEYLDPESANQELKTSLELLAKSTNRNVNSLAFPDGSYTQETIDIALALGYENLVAVDYKFNEQNNNKNLLSRFTISNSTTFESNILRLAKQFDRYGTN